MPVAVNDSGQILSSYQDRMINKYAYFDAFVTTNGVSHQLSLPPGANGFSYSGLSMNNAGQVAATSSVAVPDGPLGLFPAQGHAFLMNGSVWTDLGTLGGSWSTATSINNHGDVVGFSPPAGNNTYFAFLVPFGKPMVELNDIPGAISSSANSINNLGQIVGEVNTTNVSPSGAHAFLYSNGIMYDLDKMLPADWRMAPDGRLLDQRQGPDPGRRRWPRRQSSHRPLDLEWSAHPTDPVHHAAEVPTPR